MLHRDSDREKVMEEIEKIRATTVSDHPSHNCSDLCKARGIAIQHDFFAFALQAAQNRPL